jgi:hypothetical protein
MGEMPEWRLFRQGIPGIVSSQPKERRLSPMGPHRFHAAFSKERAMLSVLFPTRARRRYVWRPAIDLTNPRIAAVLTTFSSN